MPTKREPSWPVESRRAHYFVDLRLSRQFVLASMLLGILSASLVFLFGAIESRIQLVGGLSSFGFAVLVVALAVLTLGVLKTLFNSIAKPIEQLSLQMQRLNDGDFSARVPVQSLSEIGLLQSNFNRAAEKIGFMIDELRQVDRMKSEFISTVSHELRTPLTSIGGYVKLISAGDAGPITDTQNEFLSIIEANVERLTILINDILDMEKMESGKFQLTKEPQDLREILRECRESLLILVHQKNLDLRLLLPDRAPPVLGERPRLIQIFNNLISNAIKYTASGHVEVELEASETSVEIHIRDTGIGIGAQDQAKLFEKFFRADSGLASKEKGTGLGLAITRGLVEAHGGTVTVRSELGRGSEFTVSLPISSPVFSVEQVARDKAKSEELVRAIQSVEVRRKEEATRAIQSVWIVDSDRSDAESVRRLVEQGNPYTPGQNFTTRIFRSVKEVPALSEGEPAPAVVIVDPVSTGGGVHELSDLRHKLRVTIPVLVISETVDTASAFAEGASAMITKPIGEREFWIALQDLLQYRGLRILLADANTDFRILIKRELEQRGFEVHDLDRGKLVMGRLDHEHYDLVLIDPAFPDVSGIELLKAIRKRPQLNTMPVYLMVDGTHDAPSHDEVISAGKDVFVGKERGIEGIVSLITEELLGEEIESHPAG